MAPRAPFSPGYTFIGTWTWTPGALRVKLLLGRRYADNIEPVIAAFISATVALIIFVLSQWIVHRREKSSLLLSKLEELYDLLLALGERNGKRFDHLLRELPGIKQEPKLSFEETLASDLLEKIRLLVEFYFPQLKSDLERLFEANRGCLDVLRPGYGIYTAAMEVAEAFAGRTEELKTRILAERKVLTKELSVPNGKRFLTTVAKNLHY